MFTLFVQVEVRPELLDEFRTAMKANATGASFAGSTDINFSASNLAVAVNRPAADGSLIDFNPTSLTVKTGVSSTIAVDMDSASGSLHFSVALPTSEAANFTGPGLVSENNASCSGSKRCWIAIASAMLML